MTDTSTHQAMLRFTHTLRATISRQAGVIAELHRGGVQLPALVSLVDDKRDDRELGPVPETEITAIEESCTGADYADKLALRLAMLAYGLDWREGVA